MIADIGGWVLDEACRQAARWRRLQSVTEPDSPPLQVSVNLSPRQLDPVLVDTVSRALADHDLPAAALCLGITEGHLVTDADGPKAILPALKDLGVHIAVDDFGTGCFSLAALQRLPIYVLKIYRSFVTGLDQQQDETLVRAMIELAHAFEMKVVAEGVESDDQLSALRALGCDLVQGYLLGHPLPGGAIDELVTRPVRLPGGIPAQTSVA